MGYIQELGINAKKASKELSTLSALKKNEILLAIAEALEANKETIIKENKIDLETGREKGLTKAFIDRLTLNEDRIKGMADGLKVMVSQNDPVGEVISGFKHENEMEISQVRVPLGVLAMIFESRPNVTIDAAGLAIKSGNAIILRGGSDSINTNKALAKIVKGIEESHSLPKGSVQLIEDTSRELVTELIQMNDYVDVVIPRGGKGLKKAIISNATVPVIETGAGICHTYIDSVCDLEMATKIAINAKTHRPGVCNAMETLLVHIDVAENILPTINSQLREKGVEIRACEKAINYMSGAISATEADWDEEYLDLILSVKVVNNIDEAIDHINRHSSKHSEAIITSLYESSERFLNHVDSSSVYVNASTRFTDGGVFGFGGEIGISTQKLHARGPMGIKELTTLKYIIRGNGQIR